MRPASRKVSAMRAVLPAGSTAQFAGLSAEEADRRIATAIRAGDVGARSLAFYLADIADRGVYQQLGFHSVELYAEVRYQLRPVTTRQYVAAGRALQELPGIDRAFRRGGLFWSQVRELIRVATRETEDEWVKFTKGRTARQIAAEVARRRKGDRPADKRRRSIHETWFRPEGRMNAAQWAKWTMAREKLEAELDRPVTDAEMFEEAANLLLGSRPDGSVAGRTPVNDHHYKAHVLHDVRNGITTIEVDRLGCRWTSRPRRPSCVALTDRSWPTGMTCTRTTARRPCSNTGTRRRPRSCVARSCGATGTAAVAVDRVRTSPSTTRSGVGTAAGRWLET